MQFKFDKQYLKYIFYICLTATIIFISYNMVFYFNSVISWITNAIGWILSLLSPLIIGAVIAYLLYPLTNIIRRLLVEKFKVRYKPYLISVVLTYVSIIFLIIGLIYSTYIMIGGQISHNENISNMIKSISSYIRRYNELFQYVNNKITESGLSGDIKGYLSEAITQTHKYITISLNNIFEFSKGFGSGLINTFLGIFISFYFLKDFEFFKRIYFKAMSIFFRKDRLYTINITLKEINYIVSKFIRGQLLDGLIVGLISSIGLTIIGLDFAFLIGFTAGIANVIPYLGPIIGCVPAVIIGLISPNPMIALWAVIVLFAVQQLDSAVISPKIVGDSVGIHPVFVMMAIIIGGTLGGILGMILSVPITGVIKLFINKYFNKQLSNTSANRLR